MLRNYFIIAYRNLLRNKFFSLINILGLTIGITAVILIYLFIQNELSYDAFHEKADRIFQVHYHSLEGGKVTSRGEHVPAILAKTYQAEIPEIEAAVRLFGLGHISKPVFRYQNKTFNETNIYLADSNFHKVFSVQYISGNPATALQQPNSVVFTEATAKKYFGSDDPLGKVIFIEDKSWIVTGVVAAFPKQSHLHFDALLSMSSSGGSQNIWWLDNAFLTYVLLKPGTQITYLQAKIDSVTKKHIEWQYKKVFNKSYEEALKAGSGHRYAFFPLTDIHLHTSDIYSFEAHGDILYVYLFALVGGIILLIACFNYINLATAKSSTRAREVGVRKVLGAGKLQLIKLFLAESFLVVCIAAALAITLIQGTLVIAGSYFSSFMPDTVFLPSILWLILSLLIFVGLVSGIIPAVYLSAYQPVKVLKGELTKGGKGERLRSILVVAQFCISTGLIICTLLVQAQLSYLQNKHLGFDKENILILDNLDKIGNRQAALKKAIANESGVANVSLFFNRLGNPHNVTSVAPVTDTETGTDHGVGIPRYVTDTSFLNLMKIRMVAGHNFSPGASASHPQIMLSQEAIQRIGWGNKPVEEVIGQMMDVTGTKYELVAVIEDFHFRSLKYQMEPVALFSHHSQHTFEHLLIRVKPGDFNQTIQTIQQHWQTIAPEVPFVFSFLDENLNQLYQSEQQMAYLFNGFSALAIFIACLGLLGLAIFTAERRTKEIGVRKVLGASVGDILLLMNTKFVRLILLATVMAWPAAYWVVYQWLQNYPFRTDVKVWFFITPTLLVLIMAILIISIQTWKAARANPVHSLRYE